MQTGPPGNLDYFAFPCGSRRAVDVRVVRRNLWLKTVAGAANGK